MPRSPSAEGLKHPSPAVRRAAILALPRRSGVAAAMWRQPAPVRRPRPAGPPGGSAWRSSEMPRTRRTATCSRRIVDRPWFDPRNQQDRWMGDALTIAAAASCPRIPQGASSQRTPTVAGTAH